jgi:hypothetical protein
VSEKDVVVSEKYVVVSEKGVVVSEKDVVVSEKEDVSRSSKRPSFNPSVDSVEFMMQIELMGQISPSNCIVSLY